MHIGVPERREVENMIYSVILAAGLSSRMDTEKLLLPVGDRKLIEQTIISVWGIADGGTVIVIKPELEDKFMLISTSSSIMISLCRISPSSHRARAIPCSRQSPEN